MNEKEYDLFIKNIMLDKVVIFGLSIRAKVCYEWLIKHFPDTIIIGFVSDMLVEKNIFNDLPVLPLESIIQKPEIIIIYAERNLYELENLKKMHKLKNTFYIFYYVKPYLDTGNRNYPELEIRKIYQQDDFETKLFLDNFFFAKQHDWCLLLPINSFNWIAQYNKKYWDIKDNSLNSYNGLIFLDCGAYTGDSLVDFYNQYGNILQYSYVLESDQTKLAAIEKTVSTLGIENTTQIIMKGVNDIAGDFFAINIGTTSSKVVLSGEQSVQTTRIDDLGIQPIGKLCIKMDIEGLEMPALKGATEVIRKFTPEMAICIYHQTADIFEIPTYIRNLCPEYRFIIRGGVHTVCYCSIKRF